MAVQPEPMQPEAFEPSPPSAAPGPFRIVWRHKALVALGVLVGGLLGALYYAKAAPIYQASAQVLVVNKTSSAVLPSGPENRMTYVEDYLSTHEVLIRSPQIIRQAVQDGKLTSLKTFAGQDDPTDVIRDSLKIVREMRNNQPTNILNLSFRGPVREDCPKVLDAVIGSYRKYLKKTFTNVTQETAKLITEARDTLESQINGKEKELQKLKNNPLLREGKGGGSVVLERIQSIEAKRSSLFIRQAEISSRLSTFEQAVKDPKVTRGELLAMVGESSRPGADVPKTGSPSTLTSDDALAALKIQEQALLEDYGPDHPKVKALRERRKLLTSLKEGSATGKGDGERLDPVKAHLQALRREAEQTQQAIGLLDKLLEKEEPRAHAYEQLRSEARSLESEIRRSKDFFEQVTKSLERVNSLKQFGGYEEETIAPPEHASKVGPKAFPIFAVAGFLGLLAGFGLAYLAEVSDQSFHTPDEIRRRLGLPVVGHIPFFQSRPENVPASDDPNAPALDPGLVAAHRPKSREAESYRGVRTSLYFSTRGEGHKVVQVTSPDMGDGKSTLACNLAVSIAQSGKRVILIDADFRRPRVHKMFGVSAKQGLASVITGETELADAIKPTALPGLAVLPCGPIPDNPAELLTLPRFKELLSYIKEQYDFVVIDTPPLLAVTDPCVVVPHVDGVLLTIRISKNAQPHALRAKEILATLGADVLGVVVNGVGRDGGAYGYDNYRYGYSYKSYNYYASEKNDAYYSGGDGANGTAAGSANGHGKPRGFLGRLFSRS